MKRAHRRLAAAGAALVAVAAAVAVALPALGQEQPTIGGIITDRASGEPLAGACVDLHNLTGLRMYTDCTGEDGRYGIDPERNTTPTQVRLKVSTPGRPDVWAPDGPDFANSRVYTWGTTTPIQVDISVPGQVGAVTGHVTDPEDRPAGDVQVTLMSASGPAWQAWTVTRADGRYDLANVPTGSYTVRFIRTDLVAVWAPDVSTPEAAVPIAVTGGATSTVDAHFSSRYTAPPVLPSLPGSVRDEATGEPLGGVEVSAFNARWQEVDRATSASDGSFTLPALPTGTYRFRGRKAGYPDQWWRAGSNFADAQQFGVPSNIGSPPLAMVMRAGSGTIRGRIVDPNGTSMRGLVRVLRSNFQLGNFQVVSYWTAADGIFVLPGLPARNYAVAVSAAGWVGSTVTYAGSTVIALPDGGDLTVDVRFPPLGRLEVTLVDEATREPVTDSCVSISRPNASGIVCAAADGVYRFEGVASGGSAGVTVEHSDTHRGTTFTTQTLVPSNGTAEVTAALYRSGQVVVPVGRLPDGSLPAVCVYVAHSYLSAPDTRPSCNDSGGTRTDSVTLAGVPIGPVQLLVATTTLGWGDQWVGPTGGTGMRELAARVWVNHGQTSTAPEIRLDRSGSITVNVQDQGGTPATGCVTGHGDFLTLGINTTIAYSGHCRTTEGQYSLKLGPYLWPVAFGTQTLTATWSGGATSRNTATYIQVHEQLATDPITITVPPMGRLGVSAPTLPGGTVTAYHAVTGDVVGPASALPIVPVYLRFTSALGDMCWYVGEPPQPRGPSGPLAKIVYPTLGTPPTIAIAPGVNCHRNAVVRLANRSLPTGPVVAPSVGPGPFTRTASPAPDLPPGAAPSVADNNPEARSLADLALVRLAVRFAAFGRP